MKAIGFSNFFALSFLICILAVSNNFVIHTMAADQGSPQLQELKAEYVQKREALNKTLAQDLARIASDGLTQAQQMQSKAKISGNITAQASANAAIKIYTEAAEGLKKTGQLQFPDNIRHDLQNMVAASRNVQNDCLKKHTDALKALDEEYAPLLVTSKQTAANDQPGAIDQQREELAKLMTTTSTPSNTNAATKQVAAAVQIHASGEAAQWRTILHAEIHVASIEIISIPITGVTEKKQTENQSYLTDEVYQLKLTPFNVFNPEAQAPAFRVMSLPPLQPVEVIAMPSLANNWTLEIRARPHGSPRLGFSLEVDANATRPLPGQAETPAIGSAATTAPDKPATKVQAKQPESVTGRVPGGHPPAGVFSTFQVTARTNKPISTGINVRKGMRVRIVASGNWSCSPGGEMTGPEGYPNNDRFFRYYMNPQNNPRLALTANYGALLARIQPDGKYHAIDSDTIIEADRSGEISLDINEGYDARRDNKGNLTVQVFAKP